MLFWIGAREDCAVNTRAIGGGDGAQFSISTFVDHAGQVWHLALEEERTDNVELHSIHAEDDDMRLGLGSARVLSDNRNGQQKNRRKKYGNTSVNHRTPLDLKSNYTARDFGCPARNRGPAFTAGSVPLGARLLPAPAWHPWRGPASRIRPPGRNAPRRNPFVPPRPFPGRAGPRRKCRSETACAPEAGLRGNGPALPGGRRAGSWLLPEAAQYGHRWRPENSGRRSNRAGFPPRFRNTRQRYSDRRFRRGRWPVRTAPSAHPAAARRLCAGEEWLWQSCPSASRRCPGNTAPPGFAGLWPPRAAAAG